jgi:TRAP transporter 4TM/12TM fusion protein
VLFTKNDYSKQQIHFDRILIAVITLLWALFQLSLPRFLILDSVKIRAIHLSFAIALVYLIHPATGKKRRSPSRSDAGKIPPLDYILAAISCLAALYIMFDWTGIMMRLGKPLLRDVIIGILLIILLLEASRRIIGPAFSIVVTLFTCYAFLGPYMPRILAFKGVSLTKYISQITLSTEGIYGIPLDVSATTVYLFVLLGSMLDRVGAGRFFNDLAVSLLGRYKGGPAKAAVVSSGFTGLVSGSSIANVVTTGTFTIPLMKKVGYPGTIAAATEVAASTNGQLMPPIMGAAAFIIAEYLGLPYIDVVKAAAIPAFISYVALFYITHLEASKLGLSGLPADELPKCSQVIKKGFYFLIPLLVLLYQLIVLRHSPNLAAFNAILTLMGIVLVRETAASLSCNSNVWKGITRGFGIIVEGCQAGSKNMLSVAIATATAGIVVGIVTMGIGSMIVHVVEILSMGNVFLLLFITAIASLILGMGLPTTATYIVMASITVPVIMKLSLRFDMNPVPAICAHLFCFYFGILADDTPPVGLAAYTAAAIARSNPIHTGIQGFIYDVRTAVIPFMFVFNPELVLQDIGSPIQGLLVFTMGILGAFAFVNAVQGWFVTKNRWYEIPLFLIAAVILFYPALLTHIFHLDHGVRYCMYIPGIALYALAYKMQKMRLPASSG